MAMQPVTDFQTIAEIVPRNQRVQNLPANKYFQGREGWRDRWGGNTMLELIPTL